MKMQTKYQKMLLLFITAVMTMALIYIPTEVYTPNGSRVEVFHNPRSLDPDDVEAKRLAYQKAYPKAIIIGDATWDYNCHHYAWHIAAGNSDKWWMNAKNSAGNNLLYISDGSYSQVSKSDSEATHLVYFGEDGIEHSAIKSPITDYAVSKWGSDFLMRHPIKDCPYSTSDIRYYKLNMKISGPTIVEGDMATPLNYTLLNAPSAAEIVWTVEPTGCLLGGQGTTSITVKPSPSLHINAQTSINGSKVNIPTVYTTCSQNFQVTDIQMFRYGQSGYDFTLKAICDVDSEIECVWSCDNLRVEFYDVEYSGDVTFIDGIGRFTAVRFPADGTYNISVYAEAVGNSSLGTSLVFTKSISVSKTMQDVKPPLAAE